MSCWSSRFVLVCKSLRNQVFFKWQSCFGSHVLHQSWNIFIVVDLKTLNWFRNITYIGNKMTTIIFKQMLITFCSLLLTQRDSNEPLFCTCVHLGCCLATSHCFHSPIGGFCVFRSDCFVLNTLLWGPREVGGFWTEPTSMANWSAHLWFHWIIGRCDPCRNSEAIKDV